SSDHQILLFCVSSSCDLQESFPGGYKDHSFSTTPTPGDYLHVRVDLSFGTGAATASVSYDKLAVLPSVSLDGSWTAGAATPAVGDVETCCSFQSASQNVPSPFWKSTCRPP